LVIAKWGMQNAESVAKQYLNGPPSRPPPKSVDENIRGMPNRKLAGFERKEDEASDPIHTGFFRFRSS
jgi:hypothetical protein